jgi:FAD/FMN-containing dehydrogenase
MYELAKAFHNEKCAEFEKLCYDYEKLKQQLKEAQEFWKATVRTEQEASKETAEKILNELYCTPKEQIENKIKELARFIGVEIKE